jgi:MFS family permease
VFCHDAVCTSLTSAPLTQDRTNLGNAQTDNFSTTVGMTLADVNLGQTLFSLAMVLLELPSNVLAKRYGPERWIPCIMVIWGTVTLCQAFIVNRAGFLATRFLLAAGEAGFIPGMAWYLTRWYTTGELSLRFAIFWSSNNVGECAW